MFKAIKSAINAVTKVIKRIVGALQSAKTIAGDTCATVCRKIEKTSENAWIKFIFTVGLFTAPMTFLSVGVVYEFICGYNKKTAQKNLVHIGELYEIRVTSGSVYWEYNPMANESEAASTQEFSVVEEVQQDEEDITVTPNLEPISIEEQVRSLQLSEAKQIAKKLSIKLRVGDKKKRLKVLQEEILQQPTEQIELALS